MCAAPRVPPVPAVLRLVQTAVLGRWRASSEALYRELASLTEAAVGRDLVISGCGDGAAVEWLAARTGASVTGVDPDPERIERADTRARSLANPLPIAFQQAPLDDLPHETAVFDAAIGEPVLSAAADTGKAVSELVRVTKPMGRVVLLQLTWSAQMSDADREMLIERLELRPRLLIEWKQMMRDAGLVEIEVQDWTEAGGPARKSGGPSLTWQQKMHIVGRAWRRWGWKEARGAVERETTLLKQLARERALGFALIWGVKWPHPREES